MVRGAFIVLEGLDRSGKSTQVNKLVESLQSRGLPAQSARFPDRTTTIGKMIDAYLKSAQDLDDRAIHLLFSANRWERAHQIAQLLKEGTTIVCDRYAFSGIAFSAAKGLSYDWCRAPDIGLLKPDLVCFLDVSPEVAQHRGGYGEERYETSDIQSRVRQVFAQIQQTESNLKWETIDASQSLEAVSKSIDDQVTKALRRLEADIQWNLFS